MNSPRSAFDLLAEPVKLWVWQQKWPSLRDVQEKAIPKILAGGDVVLSARTAAGKTEAAFLPLLTRIVRDERSADGFAVLYVSPLKALINDQHRRLESLCEACGVLIHKWHGDVSANAKALARKRPSGIVLITPESLEALLVRRGGEVASMFARLDAVVIDELHAFIGTERGMQLQSILSRIEVAANRDCIDRIGLSATLGDMRLAAEALRPGAGEAVTVIEGQDDGNGLRLQIRGYDIPLSVSSAGHDDEARGRHEPTAEGVGDVGSQRHDDDIPPDESEIPALMVADLFRILRGRSNLLFAGSRRNVETCADRLRALSEAGNLPNEFFPHHGSLSRAVREDVEVRLRDDPRPTTAVATTTLELGIDIGDVETIAQIGPGFSVASLRQRLGRSGRRPGKPAILRIFVAGRPAMRGDHPVDRLRFNLVQSIAMVECLQQGWCEPPQPGGLHLSTLVHQILALILQTGGVQPARAWTLLCARGPFRAVDKALFADVLRCMAAPERRLIEQSPEGLLMIGERGEHICESHEFYPVFMTEREYRIMHDGRTLGAYPLSSPVACKETLIFAGRRWLVLDIDDDARVIIVTPAKAGKPPQFDGAGGAIHDHIVATMRDIYLSDAPVPYLDQTAAVQLAEARAAFRDFGLDARRILPYGDGALIFPWVGTKKATTLTFALLARELKATNMRQVIEVQDCSIEAVERHLASIAAGPPTDGQKLMVRVAQPHLAKFDHFLTPELLGRVTLCERLEASALPALASGLLSGRHTDIGGDAD